MPAAGGNAADAAVATALTCGVVQPSSSGLSGGGFAVSVRPEGGVSVLDFREVAPAPATRALFLRTGWPDTSRVGGLAVAVPGEGPGPAELHARWRHLPLRRVVEPAVRLWPGGGFRTGKRSDRGPITPEGTTPSERSDPSGNQ